MPSAYAFTIDCVEARRREKARFIAAVQSDVMERFIRTQFWTRARDPIAVPVPLPRKWSEVLFSGLLKTGREARSAADRRAPQVSMLITGRGRHARPASARRPRLPALMECPAEVGAGQWAPDGPRTGRACACGVLLHMARGEWVLFGYWTFTTDSIRGLSADSVLIESLGRDRPTQCPSHLALS